ncbi:ubiquinol-cytochrome C chaperone family protein [Azorhizobium sp. AG788]|uniref:ubiquinol-cytochrome C chaperone family protein n=1 Tax=Azorhizobium sp. AG788 TaxID=2183897 RepID=UPI003138EBD7
MLKLFRRSKTRETIERLYGAIVAQARQPAFYTEFSVPDTVEGRLELLMLHIFLVCRRLKGEAEEGRAVSQEVFDAFLDDMDRTMREMGIGDLSVPKKMKKIGQGFYDRTAAYDAALAKPGEDLSEALARNIFARYEGASAPQGAPVATDALAAYVRATAAALATTPTADFARGEVTFPALFAEEK